MRCSPERDDIKDWALRLNTSVKSFLFHAWSDNYWKNFPRLSMCPTNFKQNITKLIPRHTRQIAVISNSLLVVCLSWRPNFLTSEMSVALITVTVVNLLVSHRLSHTCCTCCQDNTWEQLRRTAEKQMQRFAGLFRVTDILTGALGQPLFVSELIYRLTDTSRPHQIFSLLRTLQDTSFGLLLGARINIWCW